MLEFLLPSNTTVFLLFLSCHSRLLFPWCLRRGADLICWEPLKSRHQGLRTASFRSLSVDLTYGTFWNPFVLTAFSFDSGHFDSGSHFLLFPSCLLFYTGHKEQHGAKPLGSINSCWSIDFCSIRQSTWQEPNYNVCSRTQFRFFFFFCLLAVFSLPGSRQSAL